MADHGGGSNLPKINRNRAQLAVQAPAAGTVIFRSGADVERLFPAVAGVHTLATGTYVDARGIIDLGSNVLRGRNITIFGHFDPNVLIITASTSALLSSDGDGFFIIWGAFFANSLGPFLDLNLGSTPLSFLFLEFSRFDGDPLFNGTGVGTLGTINGADRVSMTTAFFAGTIDGLRIDGTIGEFSMTNCTFTSRATAAAYTAIRILGTATTDIFTIDGTMFTTLSAADRAINFSPSATNNASIRLRTSTIRGPGTFIDAASLQKSSPQLIVCDNEGSTAPEDSAFFAEVSFKSNTDVTVIATAGVQVRIGNGTAGHTKFTTEFAERFTLSGAETQSQELTHTGLRTREYKIRVDAELDRVGGGTVVVQLAIQVGGVTIVASQNDVSVGNTATTSFSKAVASLAPDATIQLVIANVTSDANLIVNSMDWSIERVV